MILYGNQRYDYVKFYERQHRESIRISEPMTKGEFPSKKEIIKAFRKTLYQQQRLLFLNNYWLGIQNVWDRTSSGTQDAQIKDIKVMSNEARSLTQTVVGYMFGNQIKYSNDKQTKLMEVLNDMFSKQKIQAVDMAIGNYCSIYGRGYEYTFYDEKGENLKTIPINPLNAEIIYSRDIEEVEMYGLYYIEETYNTGGTGADSRKFKYKVTVYTENESKTYRIGFNGSGLSEMQDDEKIKCDCVEIEEERKQIALGRLPLIEYRNNEDRMGDWESVISLFDAKNDALCDRANDIKSRVDAILTFADTLGELGTITDEEQTRLKQSLEKFRMLFLPQGVEANYLTNALDQTGLQIVLDYYTREIHDKSLIPNFTDNEFSNASSGYAMAFKLIALDSLAKGKINYYKQSLERRLTAYKREVEAIAVKDYGITEPLYTEDVEMTFTPNLPVHLLELSQVALNLKAIGADNSDIFKLFPNIEAPEEVKTPLGEVDFMEQEDPKRLADENNS